MQVPNASAARVTPILLLILSVSALIALHNFATINMSSRVVQGKLTENGAEQSIALAHATLRGEYSTDPIQTRPFVPALAWLVSRVIDRPEWNVFTVEFAAALAASVATWLLARDTLRTDVGRLGFLLMFSLVMLATQKDRRLGDLFSIAFFAYGLRRMQHSAADGQVRIVATIALFVLGTAIRFDLACVLVLVGALEAWRCRSGPLAWRSVVAAVVSVTSYWTIVQIYGVHDLMAATVYSSPGELRLSQLTSVGAWLSVLALLNVALAAPFVSAAARRRMRAPLFATGTYAALLPVVGNMSEYRLWLPFALVLWLCAALHVEGQRADVAPLGS